MVRFEREAVFARSDARLLAPSFRWGAVFAGLTVAVATSWLLFLLGSAIGTTIADVSDAEAVGQGLGIGAIVWLLLTALVSYFLGSLVAARVSENPDRQVGMLHGVTLWGLVTLLSLVLGYWGISGVLQMGQSVLRGAAAATGTVVSGAATATSAATSTLEDSAAVDRVQAVLSRELSEAAAAAGSEGGANVRATEVRRATGQLEASTLQEAATALVRGDAAAAKQVLARDTELTREQIDAIAQGAADSVEADGGPQAQGQTQGQDGLVQAIAQQLEQAADEVLSAADRAAGPEVTSQELRRGIETLDLETAAAAARHIVTGNPERAQDVLAARTSLEEREIEALVQGVESETREDVAALKEEASQAVEAASSYAQAVLWAAFVAAALGLVACVLGGAAGASAVRRLVAIEVREPVATS